jgi:hypothetical protein
MERSPSLLALTPDPCNGLQPNPAHHVIKKGWRIGSRLFSSSSLFADAILPKNVSPTHHNPNTEKVYHFR